jgi:hypothetical protein
VPVDDVGIAVARDARLDVRGIRRRHLGLRHGEGGADLALEERLQPFLLVLGPAVTLEHLHVTGIRGRAVEGLRGDGRAAHDLAEGRVLEIGQPCPPLALGQKQVPQAPLARLGLELFYDGRHLPARRPLVELLGEHGLRRVDVLVYEVGDLLHVHLRLLRVFEFHRGPPQGS